MPELKKSDNRLGRFLPSRFIALLVGLFLLLLPNAAVALSGCSATVSPGNSPAGNSSIATFVVTNDDGLSSLNWIHITRPSDSFWIVGIDTTWSVAGDSSQLYISDGNLAPGQSVSFDISYNTDVQNTSAQDWNIEASDSGDAAAASVCMGQLGVSVNGHPPNDSNNGVSDIEVIAESSTSSTVTWRSDYATSSLVYFGTTSSYGSVSSYNSAQEQEHIITLVGLQTDTGYHFQVAGTDVSGSSVWSADNTFISGDTTLGGGSTPTTGSGSSSSGGTESSSQSSGQSESGSINKSQKRISSTPPPQVTINTVFKGAYKAAPEISGSAVGAVTIKKIEYSTDNAKNWLRADKVIGLDTRSATFSFTAVNLKDGNYAVVVRVTDDAGNLASASSKTFVIDLLPPVVGATMMNIGTQSILPNQQGTYGMVQDTEAMITMNAVGGPTSIYLEAQLSGSQKTAYAFTMKKSVDTGLWTGIASFTRPGQYTLQAYATDGAQNKTTRSMGSVNVQASGVVTTNDNTPVPSSIFVYFLDTETNTMSLWDANSSDQTNPVTTAKNGTYGLYLPAGTYYLKITAPGYKTVVSSIFHSDQPLNVASKIKMSKKPGIHIGKASISLPWVSLSQTKLTIAEIQEASAQRPKDQKLPVFSLTMTNEKKLSTADVYAKPTVFSFLATWSDAGRDQLSLLSSASSDEVNFVPVVSGETLARLRSYVSVAGYGIPILVDSNNQLAQDMGVSAVPTHYFIDRRGAVTKIITGVLSNAELIKNATN